jgi:hypothetical protein
MYLSDRYIHGFKSLILYALFAKIKFDFATDQTFSS